LSLGGIAPTLGPAGGGTTQALNNSAATNAAARTIHAIAITPKPEGAAASSLNLRRSGRDGESRLGDGLARRSPSFADLDPLIARHCRRETGAFAARLATAGNPGFPGSW